jgi:hypothetical protein
MAKLKLYHHPLAHEDEILTLSRLKYVEVLDVEIHFRTMGIKK